MRQLELIQNTPVIRLSPAEINMLPEDDLSRALDILWGLAKSGDLAMIQTNPPGTTYEVGYDRERGWALKPICRCNNEPRFIEAYYEYHGDAELKATKET